MLEKYYCVYIMASETGTLYIGITSDLAKRVWQHKNKVIDGFTKKYNIEFLVYYETYSDSETAIKREKQLKNWHRDWKINLIKSKNPNFKDMYTSII